MKVNENDREKSNQPGRRGPMKVRAWHACRMDESGVLCAPAMELKMISRFSSDLWLQAVTE